MRAPVAVHTVVRLIPSALSLSLLSPPIHQDLHPDPHPLGSFCICASPSLSRILVCASLSSSSVVAFFLRRIVCELSLLCSRLCGLVQPLCSHNTSVKLYACPSYTFCPPPFSAARATTSAALAAISASCTSHGLNARTILASILAFTHLWSCSYP